MAGQSNKTASNNEPRLWYVTPSGHIRELMDANHLIDTHAEPLAITITEPEMTAPTLQNITNQGVMGLHIDCGTACYSIPLSLANRTLNDVDRSLTKSAHFAQRRNKFAGFCVPLIDVAMLFYGATTPTQCTVLLNLSHEGRILIDVEQANLQAQLLTTCWQPLKLPAPAHYFFDACLYDQDSGQWVLHINSGITFATLPWTVKRTIVKAIVGWSDNNIIDEINMLQ
jgi:hypothetical protein